MRLGFIRIQGLRIKPKMVLVCSRHSNAPIRVVFGSIISPPPTAKPSQIKAKIQRALITRSALCSRRALRPSGLSSMCHCRGTRSTYSGQSGASRAHQAFFPFPRFGPDVSLFNSQWLLFKIKRFKKYFSEKQLKRLTNEWGISVPHVYLEALRAGIVKREKAKTYHISKDAMAVFERIKRFRDEGHIWVTGIDALIEHNHRAMALTPIMNEPGSLTLKGQRPDGPVGLLLPREVGGVSVRDGAMETATFRRARLKAVPGFKLVEIPPNMQMPTLKVDLAGDASFEPRQAVFSVRTAKSRGPR